MFNSTILDGKTALPMMLYRKCHQSESQQRTRLKKKKDNSAHFHEALLSNY